MMRDKLIEGAVVSYNTIAKKLIEALTKKETDTEAINRLFNGLKEHRKTIKRLFKDAPSLEVYKPEIRKVLAAIRDNEDIFKTLLSTQFIDEESISDYYDGIGYVIEINTEYDLENFILRRMEAGSLIIGKELPKQILISFDKVKELYMFGSYEATIVFCRALIEETLRKVYCTQHPELLKRSIDEMELYALLNEVNFPKNSLNLKNELDKVRRDANRFLHRAMFEHISTQAINVSCGQGSFSVKKKNTATIQKSALSAIRASTRAIEVFFESIEK
jgi:hypothetical protein